MGRVELAPTWRITEWLNTPEPIELEAQRGRVVVACAFQMLCPGCVSHAIPQMKAAHELFGEQNVLVVGLHTVFEHHAAMEPVSLRAFLLENRVRFPVGIDMPADDGGSIPRTMQTYRMQGTPTLLLIDRSGRLRQQIFGHVPDLQLGAEISQLVMESVSNEAGSVATPEEGATIRSQKMNVTAIRHVAFEDLSLLEPLLEKLAVITGFSTAPGHSQFTFPDTMPVSIFLSWYRCFLR